MIKQLKNKVFFIIMLSISLILIGTIIVFAYFNYINTINAATSMLDRFNDFSRMPNNEESEVELDKEKVAIDLSNTYSVIIENGKVIDNSGDKNEQIEEYAKQAYKQNKENGIVKDYVYRTKKMKDEKGILIILMQNESVANRIKLIYIIVILGSAVAIFITYIISKKLSNMIVKPVEETMQKQKQFISDASHELKTPLAVIEANVDVLESKIGESKWMKYIQSEITSMNKLINDLLFLARAENVSNLKNREIFNVSEEVNMISSMFESIAYESKVNIKYNIEENVNINANKEDVKQILSILLDNAIKHTKENGNVTVKLAKEKNNLVLQVENEGDEIPEDEIDKIFERFYRVDKSRNRKEKRYGLGLAIAKSIIEQYNGKIEVKCKNGITKFKVDINA